MKNTLQTLMLTAALVMSFSATAAQAKPTHDLFSTMIPNYMVARALVYKGVVFPAGTPVVIVKMADHLSDQSCTGKESERAHVVVSQMGTDKGFTSIWKIEVAPATTTPAPICRSMVVDYSEMWGITGVAQTM